MDEKLALVRKEDLSLVESNSLNGKQLEIIMQRTPRTYVKTRPAKGGGTWEYVTGGYVKKCLNLMFGWDWDFEILDEKILIESGEVVVKGKLTCRSNGKTIIKTQYGNKDIMFKKGTKIPLSIGNDMKSACTDCLKKCASELGIASDIYNKEDFKAVKVIDGDLAEKIEKLLEKALNLVFLTDKQEEELENIKVILEEKQVEKYSKALRYLKTLNS